MDYLATIGAKDNALDYIDRPTVKVVIRNKDDDILILNNGLLPGGGVEKGEDDLRAIERELIEELGVAVKRPRELGGVIQYRTFLKKKYDIHGYEADLDKFVSNPTTLEDGELRFTYRWIAKDAAKVLVDNSIRELEEMYSEMTDDSIQGKLYNLMTTRILLDTLT